MKKLLIDFRLLPLLILFSFMTNTLSANQTWEKLFSKRSTDAFRNVDEALNGGFIAVGYTADSLPSDTDAFVVRFNMIGDTIWTKSINGPLNRKDLFYKSCNLSNGFAMCGYSNSYDSTFVERAYFTRMNDSGMVLWNRILELPGRSRGQDIIFTKDSNLIATGYIVDVNGFSGFITKMNLNGDTLWNRRYRLPGSNFTDLNSITELSGGGFIACGQCRIGNDFDIYLVMTDSLGNEVWSKNIGTTADENGECVSVSSEGFVICGSTDSTSTNSTTDGLFVKTDSMGNLLASFVYGNNSVNDDFHQVSAATGGDWILSGTTRSFGPPLPNIWVVRIDSIGAIVWNRTFGGANHDHGYSAIQTTDGGFIAAGYASSFNFNYEDAYVIRMDSSGDVADLLRYGTVSGMINPSGFSCADDSVMLVVTIANMGRDTISDFDVTVTISGGASNIITWNYPGAVFPGDVVYDTCPTPISLLGGSCSMDFQAMLQTENDVIPARNTLSANRSIIQPPVVTGAVRCGPGNVTFQAVNSCESILWFRQSQGGAIINAGNTFVVNAQDDTTLYVQSGSYCPRVPVTAITRPLPQVELGQGSDSISTVFPTTLQAPSGYVSYVWSNLANTSGITVNLPGLYCVTVIDNNGCAGSDCVFVTDSLVSDVRVPDKRSFSVYPNPANDRITIMLAEACKRCSISVCSTDGRTLKEDLFEGKEFILDITGMSSGVYFLNLKEENQSGQMRLIKH